MNETTELWAILRADDDSNGLMAAQLAGQPSTVRVLVASSEEGRASIARMGRGAWPGDELIERRFVHDGGLDVRVPLKLDLDEVYEPTVAPDFHNALTEFMDAVDGKLRNPNNPESVAIVDELVTRTFEAYGVDLASRRDLNVLAAFYIVGAQLARVIAPPEAVHGAVGYTIQRAAKAL